MTTTETIHVTAIRNGDVYGHTADHCDGSGCAAKEFYFPKVNADDVDVEFVYEIDEESGEIVAEVR